MVKVWVFCDKQRLLSILHIFGSDDSVLFMLSERFDVAFFRLGCWKKMF